MQVQVLSRDDQTGAVTLRVRPLHGDTVYVQKAGGSSGAQERLGSYDYTTTDLRVSFTAADAAQGIEGDPTPWTNTISLQQRLYGTPSERMCELRALPSGTIRYTTDGSNPATSGRIYEQPFRVPPGCSVILAQASAEGVTSDLLRVDVPKDGDGEVRRIDPAKPATWRKAQKLDATSEVFTFLDFVIRRNGTLGGAHIIAAKAAHWADLFLDEDTFLSGEVVRDQATHMRELVVGANLTLEVAALKFTDGQGLLDFAGDLKQPLTPSEVVQS